MTEHRRRATDRPPEITPPWWLTLLLLALFLLPILLGTLEGKV